MQASLWRVPASPSHISRQLLVFLNFDLKCVDLGGFLVHHKSMTVEMLSCKLDLVLRFRLRRDRLRQVSGRKAPETHRC